MSKIISAITSTIYILTIAYSIAVMVYMWRNPKANSMMALRDFKYVVTFEKLDTYQK